MVGKLLRKKAKKLLKNKKPIKRSSPKAILDEVFAFADQHPQDAMFGDEAGKGRRDFIVIFQKSSAQLGGYEDIITEFFQDL